MCANTTKAARKVLASRTCKWMVDADVAARLLEDAGRAPFGIFHRYTDGTEVATFYWLQPVVGGWRVIKEGDGGESEGEYCIDDTFGDHPETCWECECKAFRLQPRRSPRKACKHIGAVASLLRRLGYDLPLPVEAKTA